MYLINSLFSSKYLIILSRLVNKKTLQQVCICTHFFIGYFLLDKTKFYLTTGLLC